MPSSIHFEVRFIFVKVVDLYYGFESRIQQLKMATYFDEILGDMLLKVNFLLLLLLKVNFL